MKAARTIAAALLMAVFMWAAWFTFSDRRPRTAASAAHVSDDVLSRVPERGTGRGHDCSYADPGLAKDRAGTPLAAAVCAYLLCIMTRAAGLFPASDGGRLIFEPAGGALLAAVAALAISFGLALETSRAARVTS